METMTGHEYDRFVDMTGSERNKNGIKKETKCR